MVRKFIILFLLYSSGMYAQKPLDYGMVKVDSVYDCHKTNLKFDSLYFGIKSICNSKNELEIRLKIFRRPNGGTELIILAYDNIKWISKKFQLTHGIAGNKIDRTTFDDYFNDTTHNFVYRTIFKILKDNNVFALPDQDELNIVSNVYHGTRFELTFKAGNKFRTYAYENPEFYSNEYKDIKELKQFINLKNELQGIFR